MSTARLTVSLDFELGWGVWENGRWRARQAAGVYRGLRPALAAFVADLDARELRLLWATVGAMITPRDDAEFSHLPASVQRAIAEFVATADASTVDGRDLFETVASARTAQAFASHSHSHVRFDHQEVDAPQVERELDLSLAALASWNIETDGLVFPENRVAHLDAVRRAGIGRFRSAAIQPRPTGLRMIDKVLAQSVMPPPSSRRINHADGLEEQSGTLFFNWYGRGAGVKRAMVVRRAHRALDAAVRDEGHIHVWLHPFNLVETPGLQQELKGFLTRAADLQQQGRLVVGGF